MKLLEGSQVGFRICFFLRNFHWTSLVLDRKENLLLAFTQQVGPFTFWQQNLCLEKLAGGTYFTATTVYRLPGGMLGDFLAQKQVKREFERIAEACKKNLSAQLQLGQRQARGA